MQTKTTFSAPFPTISFGVHGAQPTSQKMTQQQNKQQYINRRNHNVTPHFSQITPLRPPAIPTTGKFPPPAIPPSKGARGMFFGNINVKNHFATSAPSREISKILTISRIKVLTNDKHHIDCIICIYFIIHSTTKLPIASPSPH